MGEHLHTEKPWVHVAQVAALGALAAGGGALACSKVPPVKKTVEYLQRQLQETTSLAAQVPVVGGIFRDNTLLQHPLMSEFLCISALETVLAGGSVVMLGAVLKGAGVKPSLSKRLESPDSGLLR